MESAAPASRPLRSPSPSPFGASRRPAPRPRRLADPGGPSLRKAAARDTERQHRRLPRPRRRPQRRRLRPALPRRPARPAALVHRRRRGRRLGTCTYGVLPIESSLVGPGERDARPALRLGALDRRGGDPADPPLPRRPGSRSRSRTSARSARTRSRSTSAGGCSRRCPGRRRSSPRRPATPRRRWRELGDPAVVAIASDACRPDARARRARRRRRRPRRVHALRRARALHAARPPPRRVAHGPHVRDPPPARGAPHGDRAARATADRHGAARLAADPVAAVRLPVRLRARRPSARRGGRGGARARCAPRPRGCACSAPTAPTATRAGRRWQRSAWGHPGAAGSRRQTRTDQAAAARSVSASPPAASSSAGRYCSQRRARDGGRG